MSRSNPDERRPVDREPQSSGRPQAAAVPDEGETPTPCPVCEYSRLSPLFRLADRSYRTSPGFFQLYSCPSCGLLCLDEAEVVDRLAEFYPSGYWWHPDARGERFKSRYRDWVLRRDQLRFVLDSVRAARGVRLLDVGCGGGDFPRAALEAGFDAYGLEQSSEACAIARPKLGERIVEGEIGQLAERGEKYDVVTLFHVLEHVPGPFRYLKDLQRLMNKPSTLVLQVPNAHSWQARLLGRRWWALDCPRHLYHYNPYALMHLLGRAGFRIHRLRHFSLRDNAPALVSSLFPRLDPMSQRVLALRKNGRASSPLLSAKSMIYAGLVGAGQPLAWIEAAFGHGATLTIHATLEERVI